MRLLAEDDVDMAKTKGTEDDVDMAKTRRETDMTHKLHLLSDIRAAWKEYTYLSSLEGLKPTTWEFLCLYIDPLFCGLLCKIRGHNFVDDGSYAGPESGWEHFTCARCGESHEIIYY